MSQYEEQARKLIEPYQSHDADDNGNDTIQVYDAITLLMALLEQTAKQEERVKSLEKEIEEVRKILAATREDESDVLSANSKLSAQVTELQQQLEGMDKAPKVRLRILSIS